MNVVLAAWFSAWFSVFLEQIMGACPRACVVFWVVLFSALWSVFKQALGACTLGVSLRLVCSGLKLARGFFASQPLLAVG